jgi:hypothetical protein
MAERWAAVARRGREAVPSDKGHREMPQLIRALRAGPSVSSGQEGQGRVNNGDPRRLNKDRTSPTAPWRPSPSIRMTPPVSRMRWAG